MEAASATLSLQKAIAQVVNKLQDWAVITIKMLPNLVVAIIVLILILWLRHPMGRLVEGATFRFSGRRHIARVLATIARLVIIAFGLFLVLNILQLDRAVASVLAGVGILGIALGFAGRDLFSDFIAGFVLHFEHPFRLGDRVQCLLKRGTPSGWKSEEILGYIDSVDWRSTIIRGRRGERYIIPNKDMLANPIINYYISGIRRIDLYFGIDFMVDLQQAEELAVKAVESLDSPLRDHNHPVEFFYEEVKDTNIIFRIRFWTDPEQAVFLKARSEAIKAISETFKKHGIDLPSSTIALDFGMTGTHSLKRQLEGVGLGLTLPLPGNEPGGKRED